MADNKNFKPVPPLTHPDIHEHLRLIAQAVIGLMDGRSNNTGTVTLADGTTTTNIDDRRIGPSSHVDLVPLTANAASISWHISARTNEQATVTHDNTANTDQNFTYVIHGA